MSFPTPWYGLSGDDEPRSSSWLAVVEDAVDKSFVATEGILNGFRSNREDSFVVVGKPDVSLSVFEEIRRTGVTARETGRGLGSRLCGSLLAGELRLGGSSPAEKSDVFGEVDGEIRGNRVLAAVGDSAGSRDPNDGGFAERRRTGLTAGAGTGAAVLLCTSIASYFETKSEIELRRCVERPLFTGGESEVFGGV